MLDKFNKMLGQDELRAWYGPDHVEKAVERGAVGTLLISDSLFRWVAAASSFLYSFISTSVCIAICSAEKYQLTCSPSLCPQSFHFSRSTDVKQRRRYVAMVDSVRAQGGEALIFSSMHESGQQLNMLTGVAAILTYPLDIEVVEMEEKEEAERIRKEEEKEQEEAGRA